MKSKLFVVTNLLAGTWIIVKISDSLKFSSRERKSVYPNVVIFLED